MNFIEKMKNEAKQNKKTIVLPEANDVRVITAAKKIIAEDIANIILLGENIDIEGVTVYDPKTSELTNTLAQELYELRKEKGLTLKEAHNLLTTDYMYFACMLVYLNLADGVVSGCAHSTANTLRPALQIIKAKDSLVSSFFIMDIPNSKYGSNGLFLFSDCGLVQNPTSEELAKIAYSSAKSFEDLTKEKSYTAFLSHSTLGSAKHQDVDKVRESVQIAKEKYPEYLMDGELQLDAAIVPEVAKMKAKDSCVAGRANTLIFPDLDAGNIGYKLVERLANAYAYGPITQGINKPINDLSRGCSSDDIVGVVAITAVQASR